MNQKERSNYYNKNNIVIIRSKYLAENFLDEFDELKNNIYGKGKKIKNPIIFLGNTKIENYFCPEDNCKLRVINTLKEANKFGYHNMEVVDYLEPETAADSPYLRLVVQPIVPRDATELHPLEL